MQLVDTIIRRKINVACFQETKRVGEKAKDVDTSGFKIFYTSQVKNRNSWEKPQGYGGSSHKEMR